MFIRRTFTTMTALAVTAAFYAAPAHACATCGCSLSTDAAAGYTATAGWRVSLQYDFIDQSQLRSGTSGIAPSQVALLNAASPSQEVEHDTVNRYTTLGLSYAPNADWNFRFLLPYIDRDHSTYGNAANPLTPDQISSANIDGWGDARFIASYQGLLPRHNLGLQLGIKLPTGRYGGPNAAGTGSVGDHPSTFGTGPNGQAAWPGNFVDTSLQPGTGSTDLIVGAYYYQPVSQNFDAFVNGQYQFAVSEKLDQTGADYRPGNTATISTGVRYEADPRYTPQLQLNITRKSRDQGSLADVTDTAGTVAYLSPGITAQVYKGMQVYAFVQLPVYSKLDGYQLFPHWTTTVGLNYAF